MDPARLHRQKSRPDASSVLVASPLVQSKKVVHEIRRCRVPSEAAGAGVFLLELSAASCQRRTRSKRVNTHQLDQYPWKLPPI